MTMATDGPVISGLAYTVTEIDGHLPTGLAGCLGDRTLTLVGSGLSHRVRGTGIDHLGGVRFHQKDLGPDGRDVRVWTITHAGDDVLLAQHCPASEPAAARRDPAQRQGTTDGKPPPEPPTDASSGDHRWVEAAPVVAAHPPKFTPSNG